jgi:putative aldouronate transport system substrate-binding protein
MNKLIKEGLLTEQVLTATDSDLRSLLNPADGKTFTVGIVAGWIDVDHSESSIFVYEPLVPLADATGKGGWGPWELDSVYAIIVISSQCERPEIAFRLLDFMASGESYLRQRWGEEGVDWDWIENTEYKDKAEGNGTYGGKAAFVVHQRLRKNSRWFVYNTWANEVLFQMYVDPENPNYFAQYFKKSVDNVKMQQAIGQPAETFDVFPRTPEEDELFQEFNSELGVLVISAMSEFSMGRRDPNSDADWNAYLKELSALKHERWAELTQASYDRQMAEYEQFLKTWNK